MEQFSPLLSIQKPGVNHQPIAAIFRGSEKYGLLWNEIPQKARSHFRLTDTILCTESPYKENIKNF
ncbi:MAG: hypothetical protein V2I54_08490 [Bacteroidales bacterium]|jgi:hypothetical protein|nr:hypothetical protein [Bacteroidales bacterium]